MTDRVNALIVTLRADFREDDVQRIIDAILMVKGVLSVDSNISSVSDHIAYTRARRDIEKKLFKALSEE